MVLSTLVAASMLLAPASAPVDAKLVDATIFKNGYAVTIRQVSVPASGEVLVKSPPIAVTGTLWVYGHQSARIDSVVATTTEEESTKSIPAGSVGEALALNKGKSMTITWFNQTAWEQVTGKIIEVKSQLAVIELPSGERMFVQLSTIGSFKGSGDLVWTRVETSKVEVPVLRIKATPNSQVNIMALQSGMSWTPAYLLDITHPQQLKMTAKATIVNDLDDLDGVDVRLVTGFPNIEYLGQWDPLTFSYLLKQAPMAMAPAANQQVYGRRESADAAFESFTPVAGTGFSGEDLFFTPLKAVTLKKDERGAFILFQSESTYRHLYTLDLPTSTVSGGIQDFDRSKLDIWHSIVFDNSSKIPWTTGTALVVQNGQMLGEDELKYTTPGTEASVDIAKALDIVAESREEEIARQRGVLKDQYGNPRWDLVTVRGTVELTNLKSNEVDMRIRKIVEGEITESGGAAVSKSAKRLNQVNATSIAEWRLKLAKGEKRTLQFTYQVYVPVS